MLHIVGSLPLRDSRTSELHTGTNHTETNVPAVKLKEEEGPSQEAVNIPASATRNTPAQLSPAVEDPVQTAKGGPVGLSARSAAISRAWADLLKAKPPSDRRKLC